MNELLQSIIISLCVAIPLLAFCHGVKKLCKKVLKEESRKREKEAKEGKR